MAKESKASYECKTVIASISSLENELLNAEVSASNKGVNGVLLTRLKRYKRNFKLMLTELQK